MEKLNLVFIKKDGKVNVKVSVKYLDQETKVT
ncbi:hypothetical protein DFP93_10168 [Aneurinibacillus soli]|uniref:Uncharacterized protein n=1 Tax=Aneurinibacillus soli TaxID=1500254 RepID=A0A0U4WH34_9BACL|nr:hypothetical protein DFP93_10168 [Aneurinibacillus soli]BAU27993.1 hypothetical protein CB4_02167 [Aneurinibacillus soli]